MAICAQFGYDGFMDKEREAVQKGLGKSTLNMAQLSLKLGRNEAYIQQYLKRGTPRYLPEKLRRQVAVLLNIQETDMIDLSPGEQLIYAIEEQPIVLKSVGEARAGAWLRVAEVDEPKGSGVNIGPCSQFSKESQYLLKVVGTSLNRTIKDGEYAHCVEYHAFGREPKDGEYVHIERTRFDGTEHEVTIKQFKIIGNRPELWPDSDDPRHQERIALDDGENGRAVEIKGVVIASYRPHLI